MYAYISKRDMSVSQQLPFTNCFINFLIQFDSMKNQV